MDASVKSGKRQKSAVGQPLPHDSAHLHVTGMAAYTDDLPEPRDLLHVAVGKSPVPHGKVTGVELDTVLARRASWMSALPPISWAKTTSGP